MPVKSGILCGKLKDGKENTRMAIDDIFTLHVGMLDSVSGLTAQYNLNFRQETESISVSEGKDLVDAFVDQIQDLLAACIFENYHFDKYSVTQRPAGYTVYEVAGNLNNCLLSGDCLPRDTAGILSYKTSRYGRDGRGRVFIGPVSEEANDGNGTPTGGYVTAVQAVIAALQGMTAGDTGYAGFTWGLWSVKNSDFLPATSATVRTAWGSQRGRKT